jgi:uncharacterized membrane protein
MGFWIFLLVCNLLIPLIMMFFGIVFMKHVPKKINGIYGYRTSMSMKNQDTWNFAHQYCGELWKKIGRFMLIPSFVLTLLTYQRGNEIQGIVSGVIVTLQTVVIIGAIFPVEKALKKNFDENGHRK